MTGAALVAVVGAATGAVLVLPGRARRPASGSAGRHPGRPRWWPAALVGVALVAARGSPLLLCLAVIVAGASLLARRLLHSRATRHAAELTSARVAEACEHLAGDLVSGQPPVAALDRAAREWSTLAPVAEAARIDADVPQAWRVLAREPGAADLRMVGAAWQVAQRTGEGLADTIDRVAADLRAARATRRVVDGELASARATARLVAVLPVAALTMGSGTGGDPWGFLLGDPVGLGCLALGLAFALAGLAWIEALAREVDRA